MRTRTVAAALAVAMIGTMALAATGNAAPRTFKGHFKNAGGAKIEIKARGRDGEIRRVMRVNYFNLPGSCTVTGAAQLSGSWIFTGGIAVNDERRFRVRNNNGEDPPSSVRFRGRFSKNFKRVRGSFQTTLRFDEETCRTPRTRYVARRR